MTLVVIKNWRGEDGGEVREWCGTEDELKAALDRGRVMLFDVARGQPLTCACGRTFITTKAALSHATRAHPARVEVTG